ncbi:hypothetical protein J6590_086384 [Homalodisca vitripennis]|nr:hypothetical protein J6590_086379 [Homalodisca vitripennis]KAG8275420.1 hypothetical protein J6590_086384 [Homalodisca vitripennis]
MNSTQAPFTWPINVCDLFVKQYYSDLVSTTEPHNALSTPRAHCLFALSYREVVQDQQAEHVCWQLNANVILYSPRGWRLGILWSLDH